MSTVVVVLVLVTWTELRLAELLFSESNVGALLAQGATEHCASDHRWLLLANVVPPATAITGLWLTGPLLPGPVRWVSLGLLVVAESLHWWAIATLGRRWTTGVYVVPHESPVVRGPYRYLRHPGYVAGVASALLLPLVAGCWWGPLVVGAVMAVVVTRRVRCEDAAWRTTGTAGGADPAYTRR
jgi:methyltransferase